MKTVTTGYVVPLFLLLILVTGSLSGRGCNSKNYGTNKVVCVCNSTYCDNVQSPEQVLDVGSFLQYTSTEAGKRLFYSSQPISTTRPASNANVWQVNSSVQYQEMLGFGGAITDSVGINLQTLSEANREILLNQYYGPQGIGYTFVRNPMGGTDFSTRFYTYDDGAEDMTLSRFKIVEEDYKYKLPYLKYINQLSNPKVLSSPWSPPVWMIEGRNGSAGYTRLKESCYQVHAEYFVKFLEAYRKEGIEIWGITIQNEPGDGYYVYFGINSCGYSPEEQVKFIANNLGPTLEKYGYGNVTIMNSEDQRTVIPEWPEIILGNASASKYIAGTAVHWYFDDVVEASRLSTLHDTFSDKFILYTEASFLPDVGEPSVLLGDWKRAEILSKDMMEVFNNWVCGWIDWNIVLNEEGGPTYLKNYLDSPIIINATADEFYKQPIFYAMAHFSKFVIPGSKRIELINPSNNTIHSVAFLRPDNLVAVVYLNRYDKDVDVILQTENGGYIPVTLSSHSLNTIIYDTNAN